MRIYTLTIGSLLFLSATALSQNAERIDSLKSELAATADQGQVFELSAQLWAEYIDNDVSQALKYSDDIIGVGQALQEDTILSNGYHKKGISFAYMNKFDSSGYYFRKALKLFRKQNDYGLIASAQRNLGQDHNMVGELDSASYYYQKAGENFAKIGDSTGMADIYNSEAVVYYIKGYYNLAFDKAIAGEKIFSQHDDLALELNQNGLVVAAIYSAMKDTLNAISYYRKTIKYFKGKRNETAVLLKRYFAVRPAHSQT